MAPYLFAVGAAILSSYRSDDAAFERLAIGATFASLALLLLHSAL